MEGKVSFEPEYSKIRRRAIRIVMTSMIALGFIAVTVLADTYSTTVSDVYVTYDYGPPYSYPRDQIYWHTDADWSPPSSYHLENTVSYEVFYFDGDGPYIASWEHQNFDVKTWTVPPVSVNPESAYTGRITAGTNKPPTATSAQYIYTVWSGVMSTYATWAADYELSGWRTVTFP